MTRLGMAVAAVAIGSMALGHAHAAGPLDGYSMDDVRALMDKLRLIRAEFALIRRIVTTPSCLASFTGSSAYEVADLRSIEEGAP